ncbi:phosphomannomutase/phosphoglucomutase [Thalassolituus oleivorans]|uniref:phosphomannomutase/phosphoglucomutase n=1 Tax=Thalassolituus oleivorans TaxID=187493 RepID=UPI002409DABF|nr:phosphomannomutase/phosphoglucomutase [Thalassolituus oleivorans]MDF1639394.1 phosphomannomutase/phosphoglucomutase [Thalassolituus oleivorans]
MSQKDNTPTRTVVFYSRVSIWLALLFISGGLAIQSLQINLMTQSDVDKAFSNAMAEQVAQALSTRLDDTRKLQLAASRQTQTIAALQQADVSWTQTLKNFMPGAQNVYLINEEQSRGIQEELGFSVKDLVARTLKGASMKVEAVLRDNKLRFYWASPILVDQQIAGVLLVEYGSNWLANFQAGVSNQLGHIEVRQLLDPEVDRKGIEIFSAGNIPRNQSTPVARAINDYWFLTYTPADERPELALLPLATPWFMSLFATLAGLFIIVWLQKRELKRNHLNLLVYVRGLTRKGVDTPPKFSLKLFHDLAEAMRHLVHTLNPNATSTERKDITEKRMPMHISTDAPKAAINFSSPNLANVADIPELEVEEFDHNTPPEIPKHIFRAYDIRGLVDTELTNDVLFWLGKAIGSEVLIRGFDRINLAWDGRLSSERFAHHLQDGIISTGCHVNRLGELPTGALYFATFELDSPCGVMITGSHNPANYNGLKIVIDQQALAQEQIMGLYHRIARSDFRSGTGIVEERSLDEAYICRIEEDVNISRDLKIVIDGGNGVAGPIASRLFNRLGIEVIELYCNVDGNFPNHHPDPGEPENLVALQAAIAEHSAHLGLAFDGDGDRVALVDNLGNIIWPDRLLMLLIEDILPRNPGRDVLYDVKSSRHLAPLINRHGGRPTMWKTGHSLMKKKLRDLDAVVGGEYSGHFYIGERWYGFDDGLYAGARLLEILASRTEPCSDVFAHLPQDVSTPEITLNTTEQRKFAVVESLAKDSDLIADARVFTTDGLRIEFSDGWGLIRVSNTTPRLTLRFAGDNEQTILRIQQRMKQALTLHAPEIHVPF